MLNIRGCSNNSLTHNSLSYVAEYAGHRLETLYVDIPLPADPGTEATVATFAQKCVALQYLNVNCARAPLCTGKCTGFLIQGCPKLQTLVVNTFDTITASSRMFIELLRPSLQILVHEPATELFMLTN